MTSDLDGLSSYSTVIWENRSASRSRKHAIAYSSGAHFPTPSIEGVATPGKQATDAHRLLRNRCLHASYDSVL